MYPRIGTYFPQNDHHQIRSVAIQHGLQPETQSDPEVPAMFLRLAIVLIAILSAIALIPWASH
ncbi:hypothetical protein [Rhizobium sp. GN54]|uniref:hypothetical protein n=1 Tax=Rhizobium sp. GN54 TaxID=2898150 RepID=UPI001E5A70BC|nr:hypothetical protein [Rhizobium sp. GN54]MCD2180474.1 hypothetical protein [Rhizobium sp. GN54]